MKKYKAKASLVWELEADPQQIEKEVARILGGIVASLGGSFQVNSIRAIKSERTKVLGEFLPDDVLPYIDGEIKRDYKVGDQIYSVRMDSHRYHVFRTSLSCAACGIVGAKMLLEQHPHDKSPHFNLYAEENGELVLMTKDHIRPKSLSGEDTYYNFQTLCSICNNIKGSENITLAGLAHLRDIYNKNVKKLNRKKLNALIDAERVVVKLEREQEQNDSENTVVAKCDLIILEKDDKLEGASCDAVKGDKKEIACVKKGSKLVVVSGDEKQLLIQFGERTYALFNGYADQNEIRT